jgi:hypothetical protein
MAAASDTIDAVDIVSDAVLGGTRSRPSKRRRSACAVYE